MEPLAAAGLSSIRVSLNSARREVYSAYYRPKGYAWEDVVETIARAKKHGLFVSLNYLFFPGLSDTEEELEALTDLVSAHTVDLIQMRNLSLDPEVYLERLARPESGPSMGLRNFMKRLRRSCPWLKFGYFNPYLGD
jgi:pyruvate-formate lyase-activating enzyme